MSIDDVVQVTISAATTTPTRPGFGTPIIMVGKVPVGWGPTRTRTFAQLTELTAAGFAVTDPAYLAASKLVSQNPRPAKFKIGLRSNKSVQAVHLKCLSAVEGDVYTVTVGGTAGGVITYTVGASATPSAVATAIAALCNALTDVTAAATTDTIDVGPKTTGTGLLVDVRSWSANFQLTDMTPDPGIATDLDAALAESGADWYGVVLDSNSKAEIVAAAAWVEANKKLFVANTSDYGAGDPTSTTDAMYLTKSTAYTRTGVLFSGSQLLSYSGAGWTGRVFPYDPGSTTWAYKTVAGVTADNLSTGVVAAIEAKNGNHYMPVAGVNVTQYGNVASGDFLDNTIFLDWLASEMKVQVFAALINNPKLPYSKGGINTIVGVMKAVLAAGVRAGGLVDDDALFVNAPALEDIDSTTRAGRLLPNLQFGGRLAGAIHKVKMAGTLSV